MTRETILRVLTGASNYQWSYHGLGLLRTCPVNNYREQLHIWHPEFAVPGVGAIHDHLCDFRCEIFSGQIVNLSYYESLDGDEYNGYKTTTENDEVEMLPCAKLSRRIILWQSGTFYEQQWFELHETIATPGTVTVVTSKFQPAQQNSIRTYCPIGQKLILAESHWATPKEVETFIAAALDNWR